MSIHGVIDVATNRDAQHPSKYQALLTSAIPTEVLAGYTALVGGVLATIGHKKQGGVSELLLLRWFFFGFFLVATMGFVWGGYVARRSPAPASQVSSGRNLRGHGRRRCLGSGYAGQPPHCHHDRPSRYRDDVGDHDRRGRHPGGRQRSTQPTCVGAALVIKSNPRWDATQEDATHGEASEEEHPLELTHRLAYRACPRGARRSHTWWVTPGDELPTTLLTPSPNRSVLLLIAQTLDKQTKCGRCNREG